MKIDEMKRRSKALHDQAEMCLHYTAVEARRRTYETFEEVQIVKDMNIETYAAVQNIDNANHMIQEITNKIYGTTKATQSTFMDINETANDIDRRVQVIDQNITTGNLKIQNAVAALFQQQVIQADCM